MNTFINRIGSVLLVVAVTASVFYLILFTGKPSAGPFEDLASSVSTGIASAEKKWLGPEGQGSRESELRWFHTARLSTARINHTDTILMGVYDNNTVESYEAVVELEDSLALRFPLISIYTAWGSKSNEVFPVLRTQAIADLGSMPIITWEPWLNDFDPAEFPEINQQNPNAAGLQRIAAGYFDNYIDKWAADAKRFGAPFIIRLGHEMNDPYRYPWGPQNNNAADFVAAWKHVVDRFRLAGAYNAIWCWSPHPAYLPYGDYYPGNDYVDWIGITTLNYGTVAPWSQWWTFDDIFQKCYDEVSLYNKPIMITELGSLGIGGNKAQWFQQALDNIPAKFPAVKAVIFFHNNSDNTTTYKYIDWSFVREPSVLAAVRQSVSSWPAMRRKVIFE